MISPTTLVEWFESADLSQYKLVSAPELFVANEVTLVIEAPPASGSATASTAAGAFDA
jgi:hypothetical protein